MMIRKEFSSACHILALLGVASAAAFAQAVSYPNFAATDGLSLHGTAATTKTADGTVLRLTKAVCCAAGSAFASVPFQIPADTFSTFFQFRITDPGGINPADGIVFVIRGTGSQALGSTGGSQGYDGIAQSLGVKFDTYRNSDEKEVDDNHVAIQTNGVWLDDFTQSPAGVTNCTVPTGIKGCMANGDLWSVWIDYDGSSIHVALADGSTTRPADLVNAPLSLPAVLNYSTNAFVGFTAATGGGFENHDIVNWQYFSTYNPTAVGSEQSLPAPLTSQLADSAPPAAPGQ